MERGWRQARRLGATAVAAGMLAVAGVACGSSPRPVATITQVSGSTQSSPLYPGATVLPRPVTKPDLTLTDTSGQPYNLTARTQGQVTMLYFGYTHCPDVCPINMALAADALGKLPVAQRRKVTTVFITTDPDRDTPVVIRAWLNNFDPDFVGLTGSVAQIDAAERAVGMPLSFVEGSPSQTAGTYQIEHAGYLLAYSQDNVAHLQIDDSETAADFATSLDHLAVHGFEG